MDKARAIHMAHIRAARNRELEALDVPFMRAIESGDTKEAARIGALKQELRDIPQTVNLRTANNTPEELQTVWDPQLPKD